MTYRKILILVVVLCFTVSFAQAQEAAPIEKTAPAANAPVQAAPAEKIVQEAKPDPAALFKQSDRMWVTRQKAGNIDRSIDLANAARKAGGEEFETVWRLARGYFWKAELAANEDQMEKYGKMGWEAGERAAKLKPQRIEGWFWGVASLGQYSTAIGTFKAFFKGLAGDYEKMVEKAIKIDPDYEYGGPTRAYGRYWFKVPSVKQDLKRSAKLLEQSLKAAPNKLRTHFYLAETYLALDRKDEAKALLNTCVALDPKQEEPADGVIYLKECRNLLGKAFK